MVVETFPHWGRCPAAKAEDQKTPYYSIKILICILVFNAFNNTQDILEITMITSSKFSPIPCSDVGAADELAASVEFSS